MEVVLLGTGCPSADPERYGPATLIEAGAGARLLVDCGSGVTQRLISAGCPGRDLDAVLLTHLHSDHIVDLFQLVISSWHQGRDRPQQVFGPAGTRAYVGRLMELWRPELEQRIAHEKRPSAAALEVEVTEIAGGEILRFGAAATEVEVEAVEVDHAPVENAFGFVAGDGAATLAISGDTTYCRNLIEAATGADVLVHEVFIHREMKVVEGLRTADTIDSVASYHTLSDVVGRVAAEAGVGMLALTHFVPPRFDEEALLREVMGDFDGAVVVGRDLMRIEVAERTVVEDA